MAYDFFNSFWKGFTGTNTIGVVAHRFLKAFRDHNIKAAQIPRLVPQLKLDDLKSEESLLGALTPDLLDHTAQLFGIRIEWLEGVDDEIYDYRFCYKQPELFFELLADIRRRANGAHLKFPLRTLSVARHLDSKAEQQQLLVPVLLEKIAEFGDEEIYRYYIFNDGWDWGYAPTRIQLKAMARVVCNVLRDPTPLFVVRPADLHGVLERKKIPADLLKGCLLTNPSLEDFVLSPKESGVAKEIEELPEVLRYIDVHRLKRLLPLHQPKSDPLSAVAPTPQMPHEPSIPANPPKDSKRAKNTKELWEPVEIAAITLWTEHGPLPIEEVIRRIKGMPHLKASALSESAIRKRIAKLAPPDVRGKSGR